MVSSAVVPFDCDDCAGGATFEEMIVDGRLHWSALHVCPAASIQACGRDETPSEWRAALLEQCGTYRLRIGAASRIAVMKVVRERRGTPLSEISGVVELLQGAGLTGTEMELRLLAAQFAEAGVPTSVEDPEARVPAPGESPQARVPASGEALHGGQ
ncbi:hypothetical protein Aph02nite_39990 [Actinoplanes philippinensis]|uniref:hypothetical protein n=1 Tax=Actinoplanes philippinensis TaxID=35752 RepID=UPI0011607EEC|nr:hypothetical protein [Actinoplanes philippinensis]GIE78049.1 hypothetical protein Aph02nite_39990 [Actinoplanes philippinensis]